MRKLVIAAALLIGAVFTSTINAQSYCTPTFNFSACSYGLNDFWITQVTLGTLNFTGGTCNGGYYASGASTYSLQAATGNVTQGTSYTLTVKRAGSSYKTWMIVYADWNHNGVFTDAGEALMSTSNAAGGSLTYTATVNVPAGATLGSTRLRVLSRYNTTTTSCNAGGQGETKDFNITVVASCTPPSTADNSFSFSNVTATSCDISFVRPATTGTGGVLVVTKQGSAPTAPTSGTAYSNPQTDVTAGGSTTAAGSYVVYNSNAVAANGTVTVHVTGLTGNNTYYFGIYEYNTATCYITSPLSGSVFVSGPCSGTPTPGTVSASPANICPGAGSTLTASGYTTGVSGITLQWQSSPTGLAGSFSDIASATNATYALTGANGTGSNVTTYYQCLVGCQNSGLSAGQATPTSVTVYPTPVITINGSNTYSASMCSSGSPSNVALTASNASTGTTTYAWAGTGVSPTSGASVTATPSTTTTFTVTGTANTCTATATAAITVNPSTITFTPSAPSVALGGGVSITAAASSTNGAISYNWSPATTLNVSNAATVSATPLSTTTYTVTASDPAGCSRTGTVTVNVTSGTPGTVSCGYAFSTGSGFAAIAGTSLGSNGSNNYSVDLSGLSPAFTFDFNGITYSKFGVNGNGFIWLGNTAPAASTTAPIASATGMDGVIAPFAGTPQTSGTVSYLVSGTSPNRTFTVYWNGGASGNAVRFEAILYEHGGTNSDKIQFAYSSMSSQFTSMSISAQVGLRGASNSDFNDRSKNAGSGGFGASASSAGGSNASVVACNAADYWNANVTWTFTPTIATPTITPAGTQNICVGGAGVTLTANTSVSSPSYQWLNFAAGTNIGGATSSTYLANPSPAGNYYYAVKVTNTSGCSRTSAAAPVVAASCGPNLYNVTGGTNCGSTTVGLSASDAGATYQLQLNGVNIGSPIAGDAGGGAISFGAQTSAGTYTIIGTLGSSLAMTGSAVVYANPTAPVLDKTDITCNGLNNGTLTLTTLATGAVSPYTYQLNSGSFAGATSWTNQSAGAYSVIAKDNNGCLSPASNSVTIIEPSALVAGATNTGPYAVSQDISLSSNASGGTGTLTYSWTGPSFSNSGANPTISGATLANGGTYNLTVTDGNGCQSISSTDVVVLSAFTWVGAYGQDWATGENWYPVAPAGGPSICAANVYIPYVVVQPIVNSPVQIGNVQMEGSAAITLNSTLSVCSNWTGGNGTNAQIFGSGKVIFNGSSAQTITGLTAIGELEINNNAGVTLQAGGLLDIYTSLDLHKGLFTNSGFITFKSASPSQIAIIDNFSSGYTGTFSGTINAERNYDLSETYAQHFMGSPVNNMPLSQFGTSGTGGYVIPITTCDESQLIHTSPYGTVFSYHEAHGTSCGVAQWYVETGGNAQNGQGYSVLKYGPGTLTVSGTPNLNTSYTVSGLTNSGWNNTSLQHRQMSSGWQLLSNPYLATLQLTAANAGFDNQVQVWNVSGPYSGTYQPAIIGSGTPPVLAPFQAFMVHKTSAGGTANYTINATDRVRTAHTFYAQNSNELNLTVENVETGMLDKTVVAFNQDATNSFDPNFDAGKFGGSLNRHTLYTINDGKWMAINTLNSVNTTSTVPVGLEPGKTGTYKFTFEGVSSFDPTTYIVLEDKKTNTFHDARSGAYTFSADSADEWERFVLHFTPAAQVSATAATCNAPGVINVQQPGTASWNYVITNDNGQAIATGVLNQNAPISVTADAGNYLITLTDANNYVAAKAIQVIGAVGATASFIAPVSATAQTEVNFTNVSQNGSSYVWNFGDGTTMNGVTNPSHVYTEPGTYVVTLDVANASGCLSSISQSITVAAGITGVSNLVANKAIGVWSAENKVYVDFTKVDKVNAVISIYNILGQEISNEKFTNNSVYQKEIDNIAASYVVVSVKNDENIVTKKLFIINNK